MDSLAQVGVFAAETFIIVFGILLIILVIALLTAKAQLKPELEIELLHKKFKDLASLLKSQVLSKTELKKEL
jgi:serine protease SohB